MADISAAAVASLRARTGVSILECKKALEEANGDEEKAIDILRSKGSASAAKKAGRDQSEGSVFMAQNNAKAAVVLLRCETDFVARDENFQAVGQEIADAALSDGADKAKAVAEEKVPALIQKLGENISLGDVQIAEGDIIGAYLHSNKKIGTLVALNGGSSVDTAKDIAMHATAMNPQFVSPDEVSEEVLNKEKSIWAEQLKDEGKPAPIVEKIMMGKEKKFREENALLKQAFVKNPEQTIEQLLGGATVASYIRLSVD